MINKLRYGSSVIEYNIIKSKRRKTSEIRVDENSVDIHVPITKKNSEIQDIVDEKKQWIFKKQLEFADRKKRTNTKEKTAKYIEKRTWLLASKIGLTPSKVVVKKLKSRWGSAGKTGTVTINQKLTQASPRLIDYIIIHELCHLKIPNHSPRFWNLVAKFCPDYTKKRSDLDNLKIL
jgi:predicted metal-dependent hydrolase